MISGVIEHRPGFLPLLELDQSLMNHMNADRAFADSRRHPLHITRASVSHRKHSGQTGFQHLRRTCEPPRAASLRAGGVQIASRKYESLVVQRYTSPQPIRTRGRTRHQEEILNVVVRKFAAVSVPPGDSFKRGFAFEGNNLSIEMQLNIGILS